MNNSHFYTNTPAQGKNLEDQRKQLNQSRQQIPQYPQQGQSNPQNYGFAQTEYVQNVRSNPYTQPVQPQQNQYYGNAPRNPYQQQTGYQPQYQQNQAPYIQQPQNVQYQRVPYQSNAYQNGAQQPYLQQNSYQGYAQQSNPNHPQQNPMGYAQQNRPYPQQNYTVYNMQPGYGQVLNQSQQPPKKAASFNPDVLIKILAFGIVPILFVAAMLVLPSIGVLKWIFTAAAVIALVLLWIKPVVSSNTRLTLTAVLIAMMVVAIVGAVTGGTNATDQTVAPEGGVRPPSSLTTSNTSTANNSTTTVSNGSDANDLGIGVLEPTAAPTKENNDTAAIEAKNQVESFFYFWSAGKIDEMVTLCAPSWQNTVATANKELFAILANRKPVSYEYEKISGTAADTSRTITMVAEIDKGNGRAASTFRLSVLMLYENGSWYVDPRSLSTVEAVEATVTPEPTASPTPKASTANISASTKLYYNPSGGSLYHYDRNCQKVGDKYKPLKGEFTYGELDDGYYKLPDSNSSLSACNVCCGPLWD